MIRWPWVSRAAYDALAAELDAERKRARRRAARIMLPAPANRSAVISVADATADTSPLVEPSLVVSPAIAKAMREVAGGDRPLARHLRAFVVDQLAVDVPEREIIAAVRRGQQVAL